MAKKQRPPLIRADYQPVIASSSERREAPLEEKLPDTLLDAVAEIVHQGYGRMFDIGGLRATLDGWQPNCSMNYEYVFAWQPSFDLSMLKINWKRPQVRTFAMWSKMLVA